jgi:hypothetical protein
MTHSRRFDDLEVGFQVIEAFAHRFPPPTPATIWNLPWPNSLKRKLRWSFEANVFGRECSADFDLCSVQNQPQNKVLTGDEAREYDSHAVTGNLTADLKATIYLGFECVA